MNSIIWVALLAVVLLGGFTLNWGRNQYRFICECPNDDMAMQQWHRVTASAISSEVERDNPNKRRVTLCLQVGDTPVTIKVRVPTDKANEMLGKRFVPIDIECVRRNVFFGQRVLVLQGPYPIVR